MKNRSSDPGVRSPRCGAAAGFTLLEVLVAMTILGIIMMTVYGVLSRTLMAKEYAENRADLYATGREAVLRIAGEMEAALVPNPRTDVHFRGVSLGDRPPRGAVQFSVRTHSGLRPVALQSGRSVVTYSLDPLGDNEKLFALRRDESPLRMRPPQSEEREVVAEEEPTPEAKSLYLLHPRDCLEQRFCVVGLRFNYLDPVTGDWVPEWDSIEDREHQGMLPAAAEIALFLLDDNGNMHDFSTVVDLVLAAGSIPTPTPGRGRR
jgi:prepilin-type N-terminal cleavage/methylation domain-containing protein